MRRRLVAILLLPALLLQVAVAAVPAEGVVVCLGGEHAYAPVAAELAATECSAHCGHHTQSPLPAIRPAHGHDCGCVDVPINGIDAALLARSDDLLSASRWMAAGPLDLGSRVVVATTRRATGRAPPPFDPGLWAPEASMRTIRLQV